MSRAVAFGETPVASVQGTLALALEPRRSAPAGRPERTGAGADVIEIGRASRREVELWATRYTQAAVEIVGGDRPVHQLARWTSRTVLDDLRRRAELVGRAGGHRPGEARVQPVHPRVVGVHTCFVTQDVAEAGVHVRYGQRSRAVAARFERIDGRWICTALDFS
ncbi:MAG: Rv3235 family protein [Nocardioides sp.]|uniref:Rv3235 family protein n=1 Tax=Nocardioides sp. TaxID=35761 RepID=UPI0039E4653B